LFRATEDDVGKPVVIVVAEVDAHTGNELAVFGQGDTGLECNLLELITCVVKQRVSFVTNKSGRPSRS